MNISSYFSDFLAEIRLTQNQKNDLKRGHKTLRERLEEDEELSKYLVATFLQGSYRRATAIRPVGGKRADVDVIVVTNIDKDNVTPEEVIELFKPFMEKHYKGKYRIQGRSIGIELSYVDLDVVITSAPSEVDKSVYLSKSIQSDLMLEDYTPGYPWRMTKGFVDPIFDLYGNPRGELMKAVREAAEWQTAPLWIPDRDAAEWVETHPLEQIRWTRNKNAETSGHYVNIVKAFKWFRLEKLTDLKHPKGYPLEHMIGNCCPNGITSMEEGMVLTMENIVSTFSDDRQNGTVPFMADRGVPSHDVWKRITFDEFQKFYDHIEDFAVTARQAFNAETIEEKVELWQSILGDKFPDPPKKERNASVKSSGSGYTPRTEQSAIGGGRFS